MQNQTTQTSTYHIENDPGSQNANHAISAKGSRPSAVLGRKISPPDH